MGIKKPASAGFFVTAKLLCQCLNLSIQAALVARCFILMQNALVGHAINYWD
jgi:hypothetical protein